MKESILNICMIALASGLFKLAVPNNTFKKQLCFLVSCFLVLNIISTIKTGAVDIDGLKNAFENNVTFTDFSEEARIDTIKAIAEKTAENARNILTARKINFEDIFVIIDISDTNSISIKQIRLVFNAENASQIAAAEEIIRQEVDDETEIVSEIVQ